MEKPTIREKKEVKIVSDFAIGVKNFNTLIDEYREKIELDILSDEEVNHLLNLILTSKALDFDLFENEKESADAEKEEFGDIITPVGDEAGVFLVILRYNMKLAKDGEVSIEYKKERIKSILKYWPRYYNFIKNVLKLDV